MNQLQRTIIEKTGNDNGFEYVVSSDVKGVTLASARHSSRALVWFEDGRYQINVQTDVHYINQELGRNFSVMQVDNFFLIATESGLAAFLRRAASLSCALSKQAESTYQQAINAELAKLPKDITGTEVERLVRQRVGQKKFRDAMLDYWGGACAVTGVALPDVLRASHAKPWADCSMDAERLDVFNGFLLSANLDALFDRFLISFNREGGLLISPKLSIKELESLGVFPNMHLRWVTDLHQPYLEYHRLRLRVI